MNIKKIGVIGVGEMGFPMARNLIKAGYDLFVFDVSQDPLVKLKEEGANIVTSPKAAAQSADVILTLVRTTEQTVSVVDGAEGILKAEKPGSIVIVMSTVDPAVCQDLAKKVEAAGADFLDAAVSGAVIGAEAGTLTIMVGGKANVLEKVKPVFEVLGKNVFHLGPHGSGQAAKLINNML